MAVTIKQEESAPDEYPDIGSPSPLSLAAQELDPAFLWERLEAHVAYRWTPREVVWIVEGPGSWAPPLAPADIESVEVWAGEPGWLEAEVSPSPLGINFPGEGPYRVTATVGDDAEVPGAIIEAFRRLAEYAAQRAGKAGARVERLQVGSIELSHHRNEAWPARALQNSGAADLLRNYRRAA